MWICAGEPDEAVQSLALFLADFQKAAASKPSPTPEQAKALTAVQADLWLELARTFLAKAAPTDAMECVERALEFAPWSASVHHVKGRVLAVRNCSACLLRPELCMTVCLPVLLPLFGRGLDVFVSLTAQWSTTPTGLALLVS